MEKTMSGSGTIDYTKTKSYAYADLTAKVVSALALVALGVAGWSLQRHTEQARESSERFELQERRYLPMLRSLSVLELESENVLEQLRSDASSPKASYEAGNQLRLVGESIFVPDGDPIVMLRSPENIMKRGPREQRIPMPLRSTCIMYAELMRMKLFYGKLPKTYSLHLEPQSKTIAIEDENRERTSLPGGGHFYVAPDSFPAWQAWLGDRKIELSTATRLNMYILIEDLRFVTSGVIHDVLTAHVDLGDRFVQISNEVEKNRKPLVGKGTPLVNSKD
jgi:hypothetical protein